MGAVRRSIDLCDTALMTTSNWDYGDGSDPMAGSQGSGSKIILDRESERGYAAEGFHPTSPRQ
jgi:hypothetical protein